MGHVLPSTLQSLSERLARTPRWGAAYRAPRRDAAAAPTRDERADRAAEGALATVHRLDLRPERRG